MDAADVEVRNATYRAFVELGRAPEVAEVAEWLGRRLVDVEAAWGRLHSQHALVLMPGETRLRMANPFSAVPTAFVVHAGGRSWFANCAWDAFGVCAALQVDGHISTRCADCGDPIDLDVVDRTPSDTSLLFHCLVPASQWWDDIAFT